MLGTVRSTLSERVRYAVNSSSPYYNNPELGLLGMDALNSSLPSLHVP